MPTRVRKPTPSFDLWQQTFVLSMCASKLFGVETDATTMNSAALLQTYLAMAIAPYAPPPGQATDLAISPSIGNWNTVWGPQVWQWPGSAANPASNVADNTMFVAKQTGTPNVYVIAIGATTLLSEYDWTDEDLSVVEVVDFNAFCTNPSPSPPPAKLSQLITDPAISMGTAHGLYQLLAMKDPNSGATLPEFLTSLNDPTAQIVITGHSLGGALAPALAMYLKATDVLGNFGQAFVYPTAGATPGDAKFANDFDNFFPAQTGGKSWQCWNTMLWNSLDVVPHAWAITAPQGSPFLSQILSIYGNDASAPIPIDIAGAVAAAEAASDAAVVNYTHTQNSSLAGTLISGNTQWGQLVVPPTTDAEFMAQAAFQHMDAYFGSSFGQGLIIPQMPQPSNATPALQGIVAVSQQEALGMILEWIVDALKALALSTALKKKTG